MPIDYARLTHSDYVNLCVGYLDKSRREERIHRQAQWLALMAVVDPKKKPASIEKWWPINGENISKPFKMPSKKRLMQLEQWVKNLGKNKNG